MEAIQENRNIGENIRLYRIKSGLTIKELSKRILSQYGIEIKSAQLRNYEKAAEKITAEKLKIIADTLGVNISKFFEQATPSILLDSSSKRNLLEAFSMIRHNSSRDSLLHLARRLATE